MRIERLAGAAPERVLVTGAEGMIGRALLAGLEASGFRVEGFGRSELDVTNEEQVGDIVRTVRPDVIIHAAAYTGVDRAEADAEHAYLVNGYGTRNIAVAAEACGAKLVYLSTSHIFDGTAQVPYDEFAPANPVNIYGRSKWIGEYFAERLCSRFFIVRTSWVFDWYGGGFLQAIVRQAGGGDRIAITSDEIGCPTYAPDLAACIGRLLATSRYGIYHVTNGGFCSRYELAAAVCRLAGIRARLVPAGAAGEAPLRGAKRPAYAVLDAMALRLNGFPLLRPWEEAVADMIAAVRRHGDDAVPMQPPG